MNTGRQDTVLIVEDDIPILERFTAALTGDYCIAHVRDGHEALAKLTEDHTRISCILLDLDTTKPDPWEFLRFTREKDKYKIIPVITLAQRADDVTEAKSLRAGAVGILGKAQSADVVAAHVENAIALHSSYLSLEEHRLSEVDQKTGIWNRDYFFHQIRRELDANPNDEYCMMRFDIDRFKVFNDIFGAAEGDRFLRHVGRALEKFHPVNAMYAHIEADHFAIFFKNHPNLNIEDHCDRLRRIINDYPINFDISLKVGLYVIDDVSIDPANMCDRALLALRTTKGSATKNIAMYGNALRDQMLIEQAMESELKQAFERREFEIFYQPQYNYSTEEMIGAEALVRWNHPKRGLLSPASFIPAMEKNGLISRLDEYVWEQCCHQLRKWREMGGEFYKLSLSVSVNVSRIDIYRTDLCGYLCGLTDHYGIPHNALKLEITESAYMDNPEQLISVVASLQKMGFLVEMDDFGSGYSSLNTLKDVPVDILKLDMKFLTESQSSPRGGNILSSVIRMARWLKLPVIAEGVETKEQADYLKTIGCLYMQGYYFAKPMNAVDFEKLMSVSSLGDADKYASVDTSHVDMFWNTESLSALIFNTFVGGAAILEYDGETVEMSQINDRLLQIFNATREEYEPLMTCVCDQFPGKHRATFLGMLKTVAETGEEVSSELCAKSVHGNNAIWMNCRIKMLAHNVGSDIFFLAVDDITAQKKAQTELQKQKTFLQALYDTLPNGILLYDVVRGSLRLRACNEQAWMLMGFADEESFRKSYDKDEMVPSTIYETDQRRLLDDIALLLDGKRTRVDTTYRVRTLDGGFRWIRAATERKQFRDGTDVLECVIIDVTEQKEMRVNSYGRAFIRAYDEVMLFDFADNTITLICSNMTDKPVGIARTNGCEVISSWIDGFVHPEDRNKLHQWFTSWRYDETNDIEDVPTVDYRAHSGDGRYIWVRSITVHLESARYLICNKDVTEYHNAILTLAENAALREQSNNKRLLDEQMIILLKHFGITSGSYYVRDDAMEYTRLDENGEAVLIKLENYLRSNRRLSVSEDSFDVFRNVILEATQKPMTGVVDFCGDFTGGGEAMYRMQYVSIADDNGQVERISAMIVSTQVDYDAKALSVSFSDQFGVSTPESDSNAVVLQLLDVLSSTVEPSAAIDTILGVIGDDFDISRVYVVREDEETGMLAVSNFWYAPGVAPHRVELLRGINGDEFLEAMRERLDKDGQILCGDVSALPPAARGVYERNGTFAVMICAISLPGGRRGYVCMDECRRVRVWKDFRRSLLNVISRFIGALITKDRVLIHGKTESITPSGIRQSLSLDSEKPLSHSLYHDILWECRITVLEWRLDTDTLGYSDGYLDYELSKHDYHRIFKRRGDELCHPDDYAKLERIYSANGGRSSLVHETIRLRMLNGSLHMNEVIAAYELSEDGHILRVFVHLTDVQSAYERTSKLTEQNRTLYTILRALPVGTVVYEYRDDRLCPVYIGDQALSLFGYTRGEYEEQIAAGHPPRFIPGDTEQAVAAMRHSEKDFSFVIRTLTQSRAEKYICLRGSFAQCDGYELMCAAFLDVTDQMLSVRKNKRILESYALLIRNLSEMTFEYSPDMDVLRFTARNAEGVMETHVIKQYVTNFWKMTGIHVDSREIVMNAIQATLSTPEDGTVEYQMDYVGEGAFHWYRAEYFSVTDDSGRVSRIVGKVECVDDDRNRRLALEKRLAVDITTGLTSKTAALSEIEKLLLKKPQDRLDVLMQIDLDDFKRVNDTYGHAEGDRLLCAFAEMLRELVPRGHLAARFGGDQFIVYLCALAGEESIIEFADKLLAAVKALMQHRFSGVGCSIGIAPIQRKRPSLDTLLSQAGYALYASKRKGKHCYTVFNAETMDENSDLLGGYNELQ